MNLQDLPIMRNIVIRDDRDNLVAHYQWLNPDRTPMDLTGYTIEGAIKQTVDDAAVLVSLTFDNDLANGILKALLPRAAADTVVAALGNQGAGLYDIAVTDTLGQKRNWIQGRLIASRVVTP